MVNLVKAFKNTFLPSEEVSAARRQKAFGTTSKTAAAAYIGVGAASAIFAPLAVARAGGARVVSTKALETVAKSSLKSKVIGTVAAGAIAGNPKGALQLPTRLFNFGENLGQLTTAGNKDEFVEKGKELFEENPIIAGAAGLGLAVVAGKGATSAISGFANTRAIRQNTDAIIESSQAGSIVPYEAPTSTPLTPEVIDVSKPVSTTGSVRKRKKYKQVTPSIRVNVLNQQTYVS